MSEMNNDKLLLNKFDNELENNMLSTLRLMINLIKECKINYVISFRSQIFQNCQVACYKFLTSHGQCESDIVLITMC